MSSVKVYTVGDETIEMSFEGETSSLKSLLEDTNLDGFTVAVNGDEVDLEVEDVQVKDGDNVILTGNIEGGL